MYTAINIVDAHCCCSLFFFFLFHQQTCLKTGIKERDSTNFQCIMSTACSLCERAQIAICNLKSYHLYNGNTFFLTHYRIFNFFNTLASFSLKRARSMQAQQQFTLLFSVCVHIVDIVCKQKYSLTRIKKKSMKNMKTIFSTTNSAKVHIS